MPYLYTTPSKLSSGDRVTPVIDCEDVKVYREEKSGKVDWYSDSLDTEFVWVFMLVVGILEVVLTCLYTCT